MNIKRFLQFSVTAIIVLATVWPVPSVAQARPLLASGDFLWAKGMGGGAWDEGSSITTDSNDNMYITGGFHGTVDFDPGPGTFNLTSGSVSDIFVSKLNSSGDFVWAKNMGGVGSWAEEGTSITTDSSGNVYITGWFGGTADFDPGPGTFNLTSVGYTDIFVSKLNSSGDLVWAKRLGGPTPFEDVQSPNGITTDSNGNVYTTGHFEGTVDFDPGPGTFNLTGGPGGFISKLNSSGDFVWAKNMGGGSSITTDSNGNVYTTGAGVVSRLNSSGDFVWVRSMAGIYGQSITLDSNGNVYTTGYFPGAGTYDIFISKLNSSGDFLWTKRMGGPGLDYGWGITTDSNGNVYTTGEFRDIADFDPGSGTFNLTSVGYWEDIFVSKLNSSGDFVWAKSMGGTGQDGGLSITLDSNGNVYTTGYFQGTADFDPGPGIFNLTSNGYHADIFVSKLENFVPLTISGNAGAAGVTLSYIDGMPKTVTADGSGNYSITVPYGWSGTVTPSLNADAFCPASQSYGNVTANKTQQHYAHAPCPNFEPISRWTQAFDLAHLWTVQDYVRTVGDINGDGQDDLVGFGRDGVYVAPALNPGPGFEPISRWTQAFDLAHLWTVQDYVRTVGDVNGDGKDDLVGFGLDGVYVAPSTGNGFDPIRRWTQAFDLSHGWTVKDFVRTVGDVNGDGLDDLVGYGQDGVYVALSTGNGFDPISRWTTRLSNANGWTVGNHVRTVGDVNGDGKDDLVAFGRDGVYVSLSEGNRFADPVQWSASFDSWHGWTVSNHVRLVGDVNGDGKVDVVGFGQDGVYIGLSTGTTFSLPSRRSTSFDLSHGWTVKDFVRTVGDINGGGMADLVGFGQDGVYISLSQ